MCPTEDFNELSVQVIEYSGRLPLALKVLGSVLRGENLDFWKDLLEKLRKGTENVEGIMLHPHGREYTIEMRTKTFRKMTKLRLLEIHNACIPKGPDYLPDELRWIDWDKYPSNSLPSMFEADVLVGLRLRCSSLKQLWKGKTVALSLSREHVLSISSRPSQLRCLVKMTLSAGALRNAVGLSRPHKPKYLLIIFVLLNGIGGRPTGWGQMLG
ncbi:hypothetical protein LguiB_020696 [Lonicera macranthoides]